MSGDPQFTAMHAAENKISKIYDKIGASEKFLCNYYDEPHSLKIPAQNVAIQWLEKWLK